MFEKLTPGQEIESTVVAINGDTVFIDMNAKSEGVISSAEFADENGNLSVKEGDKIKAYYLGGKRAFCPYSQMGFRQKEEPSYFIGRTLTFIIQEYKEGGKNLLVSNRKVLELEYQGQLADLSHKIAVGSIVTGTVKSIQSYGAFVEVDGFKVLLPISEVSLERITDLSKVLEVGQEITAKVINADWDNERVSVSMKALIKSPWETVEERFSKGQKIDGKISRVADFGVFINLESGIDGLVHISALEGVDRNTNLKKKFKVGDEMSVTIKEIDAANRRISLVPSTSTEQDDEASQYFSTHDDNDGDTYNPFASLLKK